MRLDIGTILGICAAFGLVFLAIHIGGGLNFFYDGKALLIVLGGTIGATLINFPLKDFKRTFIGLKQAFFPDQRSVGARLHKIIDLARKVRGEDVKAIQEEVYQEDDRFFQKCLELLTDSQDERQIRRTMEIELSFLEDRHRRGAQLFQTMGTISPAMGLIGTLIGLVQMLQHLEDPSKIGPSMAVALLTTFYGAVFANLVFLPLAGKLRSRSEEEFMIKDLTIEGVAGIAEGLNPRMIEQRLLSFLPPEERESEYE